jgi:hypothetical protein
MITDRRGLGVRKRYFGRRAHKAPQKRGAYSYGL